jgi:predicted nucleic acid-binding protein
MLFRRLFANSTPLITSALTIAEGHGWFLRKYNSQRSMQFLAFIRELPRLTIEPFGSAALSDASVYTMKFHDQGLTLADAHGLAIMNAHPIRSCWSTGRHLGLTGVPLATHNIAE